MNSASKFPAPRRRLPSGDVPAISLEIAKLRVQTGLTQKIAAEKIGISSVTLSRLENGDLRISARNLEKVLNFFGLTIATALKGKLSMSQKNAKNEDPYAKW